MEKSYTEFCEDLYHGLRDKRSLRLTYLDREEGKVLIPIYRTFSFSETTLLKLYEGYKEAGGIGALIENCGFEPERDTVVSTWEFDIDSCSDYEDVKRSISLRLISAKGNEDVLGIVPCKPFLDLALVPVLGEPVGVLEKNGIREEVVVSYDFLKSWGIEQDELFENALVTTKKQGVRVFTKIENDTKNLEGFMSALPLSKRRDVYRMSSKGAQLGAFYMSDAETLNQLGMTFDGSYFIVPLNVNEVVVVPLRKGVNPDGGAEEEEIYMEEDAMELTRWLRKFNSSVKQVGCWLSKHVYIYKEEEGSLMFSRKWDGNLPSKG